MRWRIYRSYHNGKRHPLSQMSNIIFLNHLSNSFMEITTLKADDSVQDIFEIVFQDTHPFQYNTIVPDDDVIIENQ